MSVMTTVSTPPGWSRDIIVVKPADALPQALPLLATVVAGEVNGDDPVARVIYVKPADAEIVAEGECLTCEGVDAAETVVSTVKLGRCVPISYEQWRQEHAAGQIADAVAAALANSANSVFLNQPAPAAPGQISPVGILNTPDVASVGAVGPCLDQLIKAQTLIAEAGGVADTIIVSPSAWGELQQLKSGEGSCQPLLPVGTDIEPRLLGCRVVVTNAMPRGQGIMFDHHAIVSAIGNVRAGHQRNLNCDNVSLVAYWRIGWAVSDPGQLVKFTVGDVASAGDAAKAAPAADGAKDAPVGETANEAQGDDAAKADEAPYVAKAPARKRKQHEPTEAEHGAANVYGVPISSPFGSR